jgi:hypothetical protein
VVALAVVDAVHRGESCPSAEAVDVDVDVDVDGDYLSLPLLPLLFLLSPALRLLQQSRYQGLPIVDVGNSHVLQSGVLLPALRHLLSEYRKRQ